MLLLFTISLYPLFFTIPLDQSIPVLHTVTLYCDSVPSLYTLYCYSTLTLYAVTLSRYCILLLCTVTLCHHYSVPHSILLLHTVTLSLSYHAWGHACMDRVGVCLGMCLSLCLLIPNRIGTSL